MAEKVDLDELARLEEERDFLLGSIDDLEREHAAGDVDDLDFHELREGYLARAATTVHAIEEAHAGLAARRAAGSDSSATRTFAWIGGSIVFAVVAGLLLARAVGSRGANDQVTGKGAVPRSATETCRAIRFDKTDEIVTCWAGVLKSEPDNVEALTYQGWAKVRGGDAAGGSELFDRVLAIDPKYPDVRVFRSSVAKKAGDFVTAKAELDALYELNPSPLIISTLQQMNLDTEIAEGLLSPETGACWKDQRTALERLNEVASASGDPDVDAAQSAVVDLVLALDCMDKVLVTRPDDVDAMVMQSLGLGLLDDPNALTKAIGLLDRALAISPGMPEALLIRSAIRDKSGDPTGALADLDALGDQRVSPLYSLVDRTAIRAGVEAELAESGAPTTTSSSGP